MSVCFLNIDKMASDVKTRKDLGEEKHTSALFKNCIVSEQITEPVLPTDGLYVHHWTILEYAAQRTAGNGVIHSASFAAGDHRWKMRLMINGTSIGAVDNTAYAVPVLQCEQNPVAVDVCRFTFHNSGKGPEHSLSADVAPGSPWPESGSAPLNFMLRDRLLDVNNGFVTLDGKISLSVMFQFRKLPGPGATATATATTTASDVDAKNNSKAKTKAVDQTSTQQRPHHSCTALLGSAGNGTRRCQTASCR